MQSLWMLFASFMFAIMGVCVKLASVTYSTSEIVMARGLVGTIFLAIVIKLQHGTFRTAYPWHHAWRGTVGVISLWLWFYAISKLPLSTATTLNYMAPIWIAAILFVTAWHRRQTGFEWGLTAAVAMSFVGVTLLLQPSFHPEQWLATVVGLTSGALSALAYLQVRKLGLMGEPEYRVVFYFSVTGIIAGLLGTLGNTVMERNPPAWPNPDTKGIALLIAIGLTATIAQVAMTRAYRLGKTLVTANLQYTGIVFSAIWGILIWGDVLGWTGWTGIAIILGSGITVTYYNARNAAVLAKADIVANKT